ncbi:Alpha/Beta hydrolase protein [Poronia punctata]|nr:Alpha/Beta hydrolase protein [Poronia punctata]
MASLLYIFFASPFLLSHYFFDVLCCLIPWLRPSRTWSLNKAVRVRTVRLALLYMSLFSWGDKLRLKPGRERDRFEIIKAKSDKLYRGPLKDTEIEPQTLGATWTPSKPTPAAAKDPKSTVTLHFHGGAFVIGDGRDGDTGYLSRTLVKHLGCRYVCTPGYRLSSSKGGQFPAALQDALTSYLHLVKEMGIPGSRIILSGDSAGGNIVMGLLRYINEYGRELDLPAPAAALLWSPWVDVSAAMDVTLDIRESPYYKTDYLNAEFARWGARTVSDYGRIDPMHPYLSPLHHPFILDARIPMFVHTGDHEVLSDDDKAFADTFAKRGWPVHLCVSKGCPHDILLLGPRMGFHREAEEATRDAREFLASQSALHLDGAR